MMNKVILHALLKRIHERPVKLYTILFAACLSLPVFQVIASSFSPVPVGVVATQLEDAGAVKLNTISGCITHLMNMIDLFELMIEFMCNCVSHTFGF